MSIEERLAKLEAKFHERWNAHDKRSNEVWGDLKSTLKDNFGEIFKRLNAIPCGEQEQKIRGLGIRINWLYTLVTIVLIGGVVLGIWMNHR